MTTQVKAYCQPQNKNFLLFPFGKYRDKRHAQYFLTGKGLVPAFLENA